MVNEEIEEGEVKEQMMVNTEDDNKNNDNNNITSTITDNNNNNNNIHHPMLSLEPRRSSLAKHLTDEEKKLLGISTRRLSVQFSDETSIINYAYDDIQEEEGALSPEIEDDGQQHKILRRRRGSWTDPKIDKDDCLITLHASAEEQRRHMIKGSNVIIYHAKRKCASKSIRLSPERKKIIYSPDMGGMIYFYPINDDNDDNEDDDDDKQAKGKLLVSFNHIYVGTHTPEFKKGKNEYKDIPRNKDACVTIIGSFGSIAMEFKSICVRELWVSGIEAILKARGKTIYIHKAFKFLQHQSTNDNNYQNNTDNNQHNNDDNNKMLSNKYFAHLGFNCRNLWVVNSLFTTRVPTIQIFLKAPYGEEFHFVGQTTYKGDNYENPDFNDKIMIEYNNKNQVIMCILSYSSTNIKYRYGFASIRLADVIEWTGTSFTYHLVNSLDKELDNKFIKLKSSISCVCYNTNEDDQRMMTTNNYEKNTSLINMLLPHGKNKHKHKNHDNDIVHKPLNSPKRSIRRWNKLRNIFNNNSSTLNKK